MSDWLRIRKAARRRVVFVTGYERYFTPRIRRWWLENQPPRRRHDLFEPPASKALACVERGIVEQPVNLLVNKFEDGQSLRALLEGVVNSKSSALIYLSNSFELSDKDQAWVRKLRSGKFGHIELSSVRWYDRRKKTWTSDILRDYNIMLDDRARDYLLDWCRWNMDEVESQSIRLSLLLEPGMATPLSRIQQYLPPEEYARDLARLVRVKNSGYYTALESRLQGATENDRRKVLNAHLRLLDQVRVLLLVKRTTDKEELEAQYEKLKKLSPYPMTKLQFLALLKGPDFSKTDCLDFMARSCRLLAGHFI